MPVALPLNSTPFLTTLLWPLQMFWEYFGDGRGACFAHVEIRTGLFLSVITAYLHVKAQIRRFNISDIQSLIFLPQISNLDMA